jgi:pyrroloquinoline quinone biosynthesis protein D
MQDKSASGQRRARLARGHQLAKDSSSGGEVLICPAAMVQLNSTAAAVLALCDGTRTREEIVVKIAGVSNDSLARDVRAFLDSARRRGWITGG